MTADIYRYTDVVTLIGEFYVLWDRTKRGDWGAYRVMTTDTRFPSEWTYVLDFDCCGLPDVPDEFVLYPVDDGSMTPDERHALRGLLVPDERSISAWIHREIK